MTTPLPQLKTKMIESISELGPSQRKSIMYYILSQGIKMINGGDGCRLNLDTVNEEMVRDIAAHIDKVCKAN